MEMLILGMFIFSISVLLLLDGPLARHSIFVLRYRADSIFHFSILSTFTVLPLFTPCVFPHFRSPQIVLRQNPTRPSQQRVVWTIRHFCRPVKVVHVITCYFQLPLARNVPAKLDIPAVFYNSSSTSNMCIYRTQMHAVKTELVTLNHENAIFRLFHKDGTRAFHVKHRISNTLNMERCGSSQRYLASADST